MGWASVKVNIRVSEEIRRLLASGALVQERGFRKMGFGSVDPLDIIEESSEVRALKAAGVRVPR